MRMLVAGAGAVGGYFGARLMASGRDVTFLVREARAAQLQRDGLRVTSPHGDLHVTPNVVRAGEIARPYDLVLLAVKSYGFEAALEDLVPAVGPDTVIVPTLNGMRHIDALIARFGAGPVVGGVCMIIAEMDGEGRIVQMAPIHRLIYGELDGPSSPRVERLHEAIRGAGFDAVLSTDILQAMWEKWIMLASLGALTCLMNATVGDVAATPGGRALALGILDECCAVAAACGHPASDTVRSQRAELLTKPGSTLTASMYRDMSKGSPVEADQILGDLLRRAAGHKVPCPLLNAAHTRLKIYENHRRSGLPA